MKTAMYLCCVLSALVLGAQAAPSLVRQMDVFVQLEEVMAITGQSARLNCDYDISTNEDLPVTVLWLMGDGPRAAQPIFSCTGYTKATASCDASAVLDSKFDGRLSLTGGTPSLVVSPVRSDDNRNLWCEVALEGEAGKENKELGVDMKSIVLRVMDGSATPKMHQVTVDRGNIDTHEGEEVQLSCVCSGSHCDDVYWYKGPVNSDGEYLMVYSRISGSRPIPISYTAYNSWVGRSHLKGDSLVIESATYDDAGRYWCEMKSIGFYGIGEYATDAKSVVLEVHSSASHTSDTFSCLDQFDGLYKDPDSCTEYYECYDGRTFHRSCPLGTVFNAEPNAAYACDMAENVAEPCGTRGD